MHGGKEEEHEDLQGGAMGAGGEMGKRITVRDEPPRKRQSFYRRGQTGIGAGIS